jgi:hypothetical protein
VSRSRLLRCVCVLLLLALAAVPAALAAPLPDDLLVVRIRAADPADARRLAAQGIDLLEVRDGPDLFAVVSPADYAALHAQGWQVRPDAAQTALLAEAVLQGFPEGYRTAAEIEQFLQTMAADYPTLATLEDVGDSWERQQSGGAAGHDLWAIRLSSPVPPTAARKPVFFLLGGIHAREIASVEVAARFVEHLLTGYGSDALATWLLDEYEIVVLPLANPDGYVLAEQGYLQRKNTNTTNSDACRFPPTLTNQPGVDLNRNFAYQWGTIDGPAQSPCSQTYPGDGAASEPETQAIQSLLRALYPDRPRPADGAPVPPETSGVLLTLHSYAELVLWPWGHTNELPPDAAALQRLGERLAAASGYLAGQSVTLYPTSGTTDDWSYGELGIASYTIEIGPSHGTCGGFMPPFSCMDEVEEEPGGGFWPRNLPALLYAARVTRAPYVQPDGPDLPVERVVVTPAVADEEGATLTLQLAPEALPQPPAVAVEVYFDYSPWRGGVPIVLEPLAEAGGMDGMAGAPTWEATLTAAEQAMLCGDAGLACLGTADERPLALVRGRDAAGVWGPLQAVWPRVGQQHWRWLPLVLH